MLIIIIIGLYLIFRPKYPMNSMKHEETALDILKKRYASGEIDKETYEEIKKEILSD
jgi:putative membrane protein